MDRNSFTPFIIVVTTVFHLSCASAGNNETGSVKADNNYQNVQLGPRPFYLVNDLADSKLKTKLQKCGNEDFEKSDFSIGHRGAPLQFPEHTKESYIAAARMGAGIIECDTTFTKDRELVCRHSQCDLHTSTNILAIPELAAKCSVPFTPADLAAGTLAHAQCCTSDISLAEFKILKGKMDAFNPNATTVEEYMNATPRWRTDMYAAKGTLLSHAESIVLLKELGVKFAPELKSAAVDMPFGGDYTQADYAQQLINEYKAAGVAPDKVFPQSFNIEDLRYWIINEPQFAQQAVFLDGRNEDPAFEYTDSATWEPSMEALVTDGVNIIAPPMWMLVALDEDKSIVPSQYAQAAKAAGLDIITWTLERSGPLKFSNGGWYYQTTKEVITRDGDTLRMLDVLAQQVGVIGIFSDWPATVTYYANCMDL